MKHVFACLIVIITISAAAQDSTTALENITVTATLSQSRQKETGRNITVISGDLFQKLPVHSVDELLRYVPGIEAQQRGPQGSQTDIVIRGGTFQQVLVIIDGIKLNDPLTGHFNAYIPIHAGEIERIEILKGPAAALYGSEAVGGVINIITKTFSSEQSKKNEAQLGVIAGEHKLFNSNAHFRFIKKQTEIAAGVLTNHADGEQLRGTTGFFDNRTVSLAISQRFPKNWQLSFRTAMDKRDFNAQNFYTTFLSDTANEKVTSYWQHLALYKRTQKNTIGFDAGYKSLQDEYWFRPSSSPNKNKTHLLTAQFNYIHQLNFKNTLTTGVQLQKKNIRSNDRGDHSLWHAAIFAIAKHQLTTNFFVNESLRADWDENYKWQLIPQVNAAYNFSKITLRAAAGKAIRDADFTERYNNYNKAIVTGGSIGNPSLEAEKSVSAEFGADYTATKNLKLSMTFFYRDQKNLIDWTTTPYAQMPRKDNLVPGNTYALAKNIGRVKTPGIELDITYKKQWSDDMSIYASTGITILNSTISDAVPSFYLSSHAKQLINFNTVFSYHHFNMAIAGLYKKRTEQKASSINATITPSYFLMNGKLGYSLLHNRMQLFVQCDNIFNTTYSDLLGSRMPSRWLSAGFQLGL